MPQANRAIETFGRPKHVKKIISTVLVASGLGGAALVTSPVHQHPAVTVEQPPVRGAVPHAAAAAIPAPAPVVVTKDSSAQDIVKAIVSQGRAARLSDDQIKTVIATAKIESSFRPAVSGGVQAYGGREALRMRLSDCSRRRPASAPLLTVKIPTSRSPGSSPASARRSTSTGLQAVTRFWLQRSRRTRNC